MYKKPPKKIQLLKRTATYSAMSLAVVAMATILVFFLLGYRRDWSSGQIAQSGLLQFDSVPSGADVLIDGRSLGSSTPTKTNLLPGNHTISVYRKGYSSWSKSVNVQSGVLLWLDYIRLVPEKITEEPLKNYTSVTSSLPSPDGKKYLLQLTALGQTFELVDISGDKPEFTTISLPSLLFSKLQTDKMTNIQLVSWDSGSRYVILKASSSTKVQWLILDTKQPDRTKNVSTALSIEISNLQFFGTSGNIFYAISGNDLRKLDLSNGTISRSLVSNVSSFSIYDDRIVSYQGTSPVNGTTKKVVGIYRDGDDSPAIIKEDNNPGATLAIATTTFHSDDLVAVLQGKTVSIYHGSFPPAGSSISDYLKPYDSFVVDESSTSIQFSPASEYLVVNTAEKYKVYDVEYKTISNYMINGSVWQSNSFWLDSSHIVANVNGQLTMRDYDGSNVFTLLEGAASLQTVLSSNEKYVYVFRPLSGSNVSLIRLKMII